MQILTVMAGVALAGGLTIAGIWSGAPVPVLMGLGTILGMDIVLLVRGP